MPKFKLEEICQRRNYTQSKERNQFAFQLEVTLLNLVHRLKD